MKVAKIVSMAIVIALAGTGLALAAGTVQMNQTANVSADVKNTTGNYLHAAVRMLAYDQKGNAVGHVCREVTLRPNAVTTVDYTWRAPGYETGLYWSPKVDINGACVNQDADETDYSSHDSDSDDHWDHDDEYVFAEHHDDSDDTSWWDR
jgi:hypothetical protein